MTEAEQGASAGAAPTEQTAPPEQETAELAQPQSESDKGSDQSSDEGGGDKLTPEQLTIKKLEGRIARLTAKKGGFEREAEMYRQQLAELQQRISQQDEDGEPAKRVSESDIERIAAQRAEEIARQKAIGKRVGEVLKEGSKLDGFNEAVDAVAEVVPFTDKRGKPTPFIEAVLDSDNPAQLLKYLGDNPEIAENLADLSPAQLGRRIGKLEEKLAGAKKVSASSAPKPLQPIKAGNAGVSTPRTPEELLQELRAMRR